MQGVGIHIAHNLPGDINNRKTVLGELHWVFTAITDTIAWDILPHSTFTKYLRRDMMCASLFRYVPITHDMTI